MELVREKVVTKTEKVIDTNKIKVGDIFKVKYNGLRETEYPAVVTSVREESISLLPLNNPIGIHKVIKVADINTYEFSKMKLVEDEHTEKNTLKITPEMWDFYIDPTNIDNMIKDISDKNRRLYGI